MAFHYRWKPEAWMPTLRIVQEQPMQGTSCIHCPTIDNGAQFIMRNANRAHPLFFRFCETFPFPIAEVTASLCLVNKQRI